MRSFNIYNFFFSSIDINRLFFSVAWCCLKMMLQKGRKLDFLSLITITVSMREREKVMWNETFVWVLTARRKITDISGRKSNIRLWHFSTYFLLARLHYDSISHFWRRQFSLSCLLVGVLMRYRLSIMKISFTHRDIECSSFHAIITWWKFA